MASKAAQRAQGRWLPGTSGNASGRPAGRPNRSHAYLRQLLNGKADQVVRAVVDAAIAGDMHAAKLILDRVLPKHVCRPIEDVVVPVISNPSDACAAITSIANAALGGLISTAEAAEFSAVVETYRRTVETAEVFARLERLEQIAAKKQ